ncbi:MAG TPA: sigma factor-like helix-turn-helix DNA-binding protein [Patescibacteria group bacterium]
MNKEEIMAGSELRLDISLHNKRLLDLILGSFPSVASFCQEKAFGHTELGLYINLKKSPIRKTTGKYRTMCQRLADIFFVDVDWLFPLELYSLEKTSLSIEMRAEHISFHKCTQIAVEPEQYEVYELNNLKEKIDFVLSTLTPREERIVRMYFGIGGEDYNKSFILIAPEFDVTSQRVRQIFVKAMRKLRHPSRAYKLKSFVE